MCPEAGPVSLISALRQLARCPSHSRSLWKGGGRGKRQVCLTSGSPGSLSPPLGIMDHPFSQVQAGRGRGVTPRVTQSALLRSLATWPSPTLVYLLVNASRRRAMTHGCVTRRECGTAGRAASVSAWPSRGGLQSSGDPGLGSRALAARAC